MQKDAMYIIRHGIKYYRVIRVKNSRKRPRVVKKKKKGRKETEGCYFFDSRYNYFAPRSTLTFHQHVYATWALKKII